MGQKRWKVLLSCVLALCLVVGLVSSAGAVNAGYTDLGTLRVSVNGDIYHSLALLEEASGKVFLPVGTVEEFLGACPRSIKFNGVRWGDVSAAADSCVYDEALDSLYIWDSLPEVNAATEELYPELGEPTDQAITFREFFQMMDRAVLLADGSKLAQWREKLPLARNSDQVLSRIEGMEALLCLAATLGEDYTEFNRDWLSLFREMEAHSGEELVRLIETRGHYGDVIPIYDPYSWGGFEKTPNVDGLDVETMALRYAYARASLVSGNPLFDFDREARSLHLDQPLTVRAAATALTRLLDSAEASAGKALVPLDDPAATHYDENIITPELLAWAENMPPIVDENGSFIKWNGAVLYGAYDDRTLDMSYTPLSLRKFSEYGFNCARSMVTFQTFFDLRVTGAKLGELRKLDQLIAYAIRYRIHLNVNFMTMPGRWTSDLGDYSYTGEFDLFTNTDRQEEAKRVCRLLGQRYAGIPNEALSFTPLWETGNKNLSSGVPADPIDPKDVAPVYRDLVQEIRKGDPNCFIIYEPPNHGDMKVSEEYSRPTRALLEPLGNVQVMDNFGSMEYIYAEMPDPTAGLNIDNCCHAMFKPEYPVTYYFVSEIIQPDGPLILQGGLPKGTKIDVYLAKNTTGTFQILADGSPIYSETLTAQEYTVGGTLSWFYPYAKSDKLISVTLPSDAQQVELAFTGTELPTELRWCGMNVILPEEYAVERWWFPSEYDSFLEGAGAAGNPEKRRTSDIMISPYGDEKCSNVVTIHTDTVSFTTEMIYDQANRETIFEWGRAASGYEPHTAIRIERAAFYLGTQYSSALRYYGDTLDMCDTYNFGWFTNDLAFYEMFYPEGRLEPKLPYVEAEYTPCADGAALKEMLQLYQSHMPAQTPASQLEVSFGDVPEGGTLYLAGYSAENRMVCLEERKPSEPEGSFLVIPQEGLTYKAFLLDDRFRPTGWVRLSES